MRKRIPTSAPLPVPTMIDVGVASPRAHGQAMIRTDTVLSRARLKAGSGPATSQTTNVRAASPITTGTNTPVTASARRWIGRPCLRHQPDDLGEDRVTADPGRANVQRPGRVDRRPDDLVAGRLGDEDALARDHALIDGRATVHDNAVHGDLLAGPHPEHFADYDRHDRDFELVAVTHDARRSRRELMSRRMASDVEDRARASR